MSLIFPAALLLAAFLAALIPILVLIGTIQVRKKYASGFMHVIPYGIVITSALLIAYAGRDFSIMLSNPGLAKPAIVSWGQRIFTVIMLLASAERLGSYILGTSARRIHGPIAMTFGLFWLCSALLPMFTGRYSTWSHEIAYPLLMGLAALTLGTAESDQFIRATRNSIVLFALASWVMALISPHSTLETNYSQGYLPGVPRMAGLAAHAVALGMLMQIGMLCLWAKPFDHKSLNRLAWIAMLSALFLSQAKAAWISTLLCSLVMIKARGDGQLMQRIFNSRSPMIGSLFIALITTTIALSTVLLAAKGQHAGDFLSTKEGAQLASLTGRDVIWTAALNEWEKHPLFGFGTELFSAEHRASLGLPSAIHAHNQFIDTLARSGLVGAISFLIYALALGFYAIKYSKETNGLSLAVYLALFIRGIGEIPFTLAGYGHEFLTHILLLAVISSAASKKQSNESRNSSSTSSPSQAATEVKIKPEHNGSAKAISKYQPSTSQT